ncbi:MAG TPA: hypothetical protein VMT35_15870 [Ignavibacteriaceae bacterium]|nr:hypothetical protein [Ignavibacteriaceae bacterium]
MELIPILSTIILAATAATFILAIGAYILYKIRERRVKSNIIQPPPKYEAELVAPAKNENEEIPDDLKVQPDDLKRIKRNLDSLKDSAGKKEQMDVSLEPKEAKKIKSKFLKYTSEGFISPKDDKKKETTRWR